MTPALAARRFGARTYAKLSSNENPFGPSPRAVEKPRSTPCAHPETYRDSTSGALLRSAVGGGPSPRAAGAGGGGAGVRGDHRLFPSAPISRQATPCSSRGRPSPATRSSPGSARGRDPRCAARRRLQDRRGTAVRAALARQPTALALCTPNNNPSGERTSRAGPGRDPRSDAAPDHRPSRRGLCRVPRRGERARPAGGLGRGVPPDTDVLQGLWPGRPARGLRRGVQPGGHRCPRAPEAGVQPDRRRRRRRPSPPSPTRITCAAAWRRSSPSASGCRTRHGRGSASSIRSSEANFVFVRSPIALEAAFERFLAAGLIVRPIRFGEGYFRISVGLPPENDRVLDTLAAMIRMSVDDMAMARPVAGSRWAGLSSMRPTPSVFTFVTFRSVQKQNVMAGLVPAYP